MAAPTARRCFFQCFQRLPTKTNNRTAVCRHIPAAVTQQVRSAMYNPTYVSPVVEKSELPEELSELEDRLYKPVKAMEIDQRISASYDPLLERFINCVMSTGERALAKDIVSKAFEKVKLIQVERYHRAESDEERAKINCDPLKIFHQAYNNVRPVLRLMPFVRGGILYQVPMAARDNQSELTAFRWIRDSAKDKAKRISFWDSLARELLDASQNTGKSMRKKLELHKQCEANKAYAHFRWTK